MAALVVLHPRITATKISQSCDTHINVAELMWGGETTMVINQYCQFRDPIEVHMCKLLETRKCVGNKSILYATDVNVKAVEWHADHTDEKGDKILETFERTALHILNASNQPLTYCSPQGRQTNIDEARWRPQLGWHHGFLSGRYARTP